MAASFVYTSSVAANIREKDDPINGVMGGCAAGFLAGVRGSSIFLPIPSVSALLRSCALELMLSMLVSSILSYAHQPVHYQ